MEQAACGLFGPDRQEMMGNGVSGIVLYDDVVQ